MTDPRPLFHDKVFARLQAAVREAAAEVPELEAVAFVALWRLDDQSGIPEVLVQGSTGPLVNPDQFLRLHLATLRLEQFCVDQSARGVVALRELATHMARQARDRHEPQAQGPQPPPPEGPPGHGDGAIEHDPAR